MSAKVDVKISSVDQRLRECPEWDNYVRRSDGATGAHLYAWKNIIGDVFGHATHNLIARNQSGAVVGVLPVVRQKSVLFGDRLISMPYLNYGGVLADDDDIAQQLMREATAAARDMGSTHVEFRDTRQYAHEMPTRTDKACMILDLPETADELFSALGSKLRSQIRRPAKEGAVAIEGRLELLDEFYSVLRHNWRDLGTPLYSKRFFQSILEYFEEDSHLLVVRLEGKPVAAAFFLGFGGQLEIPWAASLREHNRIAVNMMLYWEGLRLAIEKGYRKFDFGRSSVDSGTYRFKKQWGAKPKQLYWHYWLRDGDDVPQINPDNPKYRLAIRAWQHLPVSVTGVIGPLIAKNLP